MHSPSPRPFSSIRSLPIPLVATAAAAVLLAACGTGGGGRDRTRDEDTGLIDSGDGGVGDDTPSADGGDTGGTDAAEDAGPDTRADTELPPPADTGDEADIISPDIVDEEIVEPPGGTGTPCLRGADCPSNICTPIADDAYVCTTTCDADADCVAGWACRPVADLASDVCRCTTSGEVCDGLDNDCDGLVDEGDALCEGLDVCDASACTCPPPFEACDGICSDLSSSTSDCGTCGNACAPTQTCAAGTCACPVGFELCNDLCIDTSADSSNCGGCGTTCDVTEICDGGECVCGGRFRTCEGECIDPSTDERYCGGCATTCGPIDYCAAGACSCVCGGDACLTGACLPVAYLGEAVQKTLEFTTTLTTADVVFNVDTTGSMGEEIDQLQDTLSGTIISGLYDVITNPAFGVTRYDDFPCGGYGTTGDVPFQLMQRVTLSATRAQTAVNSLSLHNGQDLPESGVEALYQIATGLGRSQCYTVPAFNPSLNFEAGVADGRLGGVGFRDGSLPLVVQITDAVSHARGESSFPYGASRDEAYSALNGVGARVIGVVSGSSTDARLEVEQFAIRTGAVVPVCAFDDVRTGTCASTQCCTGDLGAGVAPIGGDCPLVFRTNSSGSGFGQAVLNGLSAYLRFGRFVATLRVRRDEAEFGSSGIDTTCLVNSVAPASGIAPPGDCGATPTPADTNGDGLRDGFRDVTPGTRLRFGVELNNACVPPSSIPQSFAVHFDVVAPGGLVLGTRTLVVTVPPAP